MGDNTICIAAVSSKNKEGLLVKSTRLEKLTRWEAPLQPESNRKEADVLNKTLVGNNVHRLLANENKHKRGKNDCSSISSLDKVLSVSTYHTPFRNL